MTHRVLVAGGVAGALAFAYGAIFGDALRAWQALLVNFLFFAGLAHAGVVISAVLLATSARWARPLIRTAEATAGFIPVAFVLLLVLLAGLPAWAPWVGHTGGDRAGWLTIPAFVVREIMGFLVLGGLCAAYVNRALRPGRGRREGLAPAVLITYAWVYSLVAFDFVMALDHHWVSTLAGGYFFTGNLLIGIAFVTIVTILGAGAGRDGQALGTAQLHDLGKLLFGFCILWAYMLWSQYLVIWYGDLPEETAFIAARMEGAWAVPTWASFVLVFVVPFMVLLSRRVKTSGLGLGVIAGAVLLGMWIERFVLVSPSLSPDHVAFGAIEVLVTVGMLSTFTLCYTWLFRLYPAPVLPDGPQPGPS